MESRSFEKFYAVLFVTFVIAMTALTVAWAVLWHAHGEPSGQLGGFAFLALFGAVAFGLMWNGELSWNYQSKYYEWRDGPAIKVKQGHR